MPHTQFQSSPYLNVGPSSSHFSPDLGFPEEYDSTYHQAPHHHSTQQSQYQTPQDSFPFYPLYSNNHCYRPSMESHPLPRRSNFEGMGNRLYQSGSSIYDDLTDLMDPVCIDFAGPSTQPQQENRRNPPRDKR
ncbi:unnamed protein product [Vicia faba]|uniref:Uncharacterized protein n=1 Tax=Vicia faba TaxID=3906 RepID=A0AAV1APW1_VICFA|nr:unnamed protein product [Vicia faba]